MATASRSEYLHHLTVQRVRLSRQCAAFDGGDYVAHLDISTTLRVLLHGGTALLNRVGFLDESIWIGIGVVDPDNLITTSALTQMQMNFEVDSVLFGYIPWSREDVIHHGQTYSFADWWNQPVLKDQTGYVMSRKSIVTTITNSAGGAHVGPLDAKPGAVHETGSLGWSLTVGDDPQDEVALTVSPLPASIRTIAQEVELSLNAQEHVLIE